MHKFVEVSRYAAKRCYRAGSSIYVCPEGDAPEFLTGKIVLPGSLFNQAVAPLRERLGKLDFYVVVPQ